MLQSQAFSAVYRNCTSEDGIFLSVKPFYLLSCLLIVDLLLLLLHHPCCHFIMPTASNPSSFTETHISNMHNISTIVIHILQGVKLPYMNGSKNAIVTIIISRLVLITYSSRS
jgi:hypothetical protein